MVVVLGEEQGRSGRGYSIKVFRGWCDGSKKAQPGIVVWNVVSARKRVTLVVCWNWRRFYGWLRKVSGLIWSVFRSESSQYLDGLTTGVGWQRDPVETVVVNGKTHTHACVRRELRGSKRKKRRRRWLELIGTAPVERIKVRMLEAALSII